MLVDVGEIVGTAEVAERAFVAQSTVHKWRRRYPDFPQPIRVLKSGPIWKWSDVEAWLNERTPDAKKAPPN